MQFDITHKVPGAIDLLFYSPTSLHLDMEILKTFRELFQ